MPESEPSTHGGCIRVPPISTPATTDKATRRRRCGRGRFVGLLLLGSHRLRGSGTFARQLMTIIRTRRSSGGVAWW
jgi:hypothetical protein